MQDDGNDFRAHGLHRSSPISVHTVQDPAVLNASWECTVGRSQINDHTQESSDETEERRKIEINSDRSETERHLSPQKVMSKNNISI